MQAISSSRPVFVGIGPVSAVNAYLANVARAQGDTFATRSSDFRVLPGAAPSSPPTAQHFWSASATGAGQQTLTWMPQNGNWRIVLMNAHGSRAVNAEREHRRTRPASARDRDRVLGAGLLLLLLSGGGIFLAVRRR